MADDTAAKLDQLASTVEKLNSSVAGLGPAITKALSGFKGDAVSKAAAGIQGLTDSTQNLSKGFEGLNNINLTSIVTKVNDTFGALSINTNLLFDAIKDVTKGAGRLIENLENSTKTSKGMEAGLALLTTSVIGTSAAFEQMAEKNDFFANNIGKDMEMISKFSSFLGDKLPKGIGGAIKAFSGMGATVATVVDNVIQAENSFFNMQAAMGQVGSLVADQPRGLTEYKQTLDGLSSSYSNFNELLYQTARANGTSLQSVQNYATTLSKVIPNAFGTLISLTKDGKNNTTLLDAAMKAARGTTGDLADATSFITKEFQNFGKATEGSIKNLIQTFELTQKLKLPFKEIQSAVQDSSDMFRDLGDNTNGVIQIFNRLGPALQASKTGISSMKEIFQSVTGAISNLSIGQKAFLSQQSGGAGGLRGAFQIDKLLEEGKVNEVYKKMEESLKRNFGGKIRTRDEAASSDAAASDFVRQIQFLRSGPFGSLVKSDAQASKLLEAFKTKSTETIGRDGLVESTLQNTENKIKSQTSVIQSAKLEVEYLQLTNTAALADAMRDVFLTKEASNNYRQKGKEALVSSAQTLVDEKGNSKLPGDPNITAQRASDSRKANIWGPISDISEGKAPKTGALGEVLKGLSSSGHELGKLITDAGKEFKSSVVAAFTEQRVRLDPIEITINFPDGTKQAAVVDADLTQATQGTSPSKPTK